MPLSLLKDLLRAILASVARTFVQPEAALQVASSVTTLTELRAHLRVEESSSQSH